MPARRDCGTWVVTTTANETVRAFVPAPLPPSPDLQLSSADFDLMERANRALGRLDGLTALLPDTSLFVYMYVRKEAVLSSQIEGSQSSLSALLAHELEESAGVPFNDVIEVSRYVAAMDHGLRRLRSGVPISLRLIREIHGVLLVEGRGSANTAGEFRRSQNWIGGSRPGDARYVPPPPDRLMECLGAFEEFLHDQPVQTPLLIKAALAHVQFENIHPFLDGNGRLGRLLITLLLCSEQALREPTLYLSLHFKQHRDEYYERLQRVRTHGEWEEWLRFFLEGVLSTAHQAVETARSVLDLFERDRLAIQAVGRAAASVLRVHEILQRHPLLSIQGVAARAGLSVPTSTASLRRLQELGMVNEVTGRRRGRRYSYAKYVALLAAGTEPL